MRDEVVESRIVVLAENIRAADTRPALVGDLFGIEHINIYVFFTCPSWIFFLAREGRALREARKPFVLRRVVRYCVRSTLSGEKMGYQKCGWNPAYNLSGVFGHVTSPPSPDYYTTPPTVEP